MLLAHRAVVSLLLIAVIGAVAWGWCFMAPDQNRPHGLLESSALPMAPLFMFGLLDSLCQIWSYWIMSNLCNDSNNNNWTALVHYAGFYKTMRAIGVACAATFHTSSTGQHTSGNMQPSLWLARKLEDSACSLSLMSTTLNPVIPFGLFAKQSGCLFEPAFPPNQTNWQ